MNNREASAQPAWSSITMRAAVADIDSGCRSAGPNSVRRPRLVLTANFAAGRVSRAIWTLRRRPCITRTAVPSPGDQKPAGENATTDAARPLRASSIAT